MEDEALGVMYTRGEVFTCELVAVERVEDVEEDWATRREGRGVEGHV